MGTNFHTAYDTAKKFLTTDINPVPASLDKAITYLKNIQVSCAGIVYYNKVTGVLAWSGVITILFNDQNGIAKANTINASSVTLADNQFAYVDLNETNNTVLTVSVATVTTASASNFILFNRLVLGYRNTTSDEFYPVYLRNVKEGIVDLTSAASLTVTWSKGNMQRVKNVAHNITFTFAGGTGLWSNERLILILINDATGNHTITLPGTVRYGVEFPSYTMTVTASKGDKLGFIYDLDAAKYDLVSVVKGY